MAVDADGLSDAEITTAIERALVAELDVHPSDIEVIYDSENNVATYIISSDDAESLNSIISETQREDFHITPENISIESIDASAEIVVNVDVNVNVSNVTDADTVVDSIIESLQTQDPSLIIDGAIDFITSAPSNLPSVKPTAAPLTAIPTAVPSISGWVASISATTIATQEFDDASIEDYTSNIAEFYGVDATDVTPVVTYETTGSMIVSIPENLSEEELAEVVTSSIADSLGVHPSNVAITIDMNSGEVEFVITTNDFSEASSLQFNLENGQNQDEIINSIENAIPSVTVEEYIVSDDVIAMVGFTVDADEAENDLTQAAWQSEQFLSDFDVTVESEYITHAPTFVPSRIPTTSLPTQSPSITGNIFFFCFQCFFLM